jgi:hypothetical protein
MRRLMTTALVLSAILVAACGGGDDSGSALDSALSYLPKDAPFALALDTDLEGDQYQALQEHLNKFPFGDQIEESLRQQFEQSSGGGDFDKDVRPMLGNPLVVGGTDVKELSGGSGFVAALQVRDEGKLDDLLDQEKPRKVGEASGATIYEDDGTVIAIEDDMVVLGSDRQEVTITSTRRPSTRDSAACPRAPWRASTPTWRHSSRRTRTAPTRATSSG